MIGREGKGDEERRLLTEHVKKKMERNLIFLRKMFRSTDKQLLLQSTSHYSSIGPQLVAFPTDLLTHAKSSTRSL